MEFSKVLARAKEIRAMYAEFETKKNGKEWTTAQIAQGFAGDVGDLMKLVMAKDGLRDDVENLDEKLQHELSDCLWCVMILADKFNINLEDTFLDNMDLLEQRIKKDI